MQRPAVISTVVLLSLSLAFDDTRTGVGTCGACLMRPEAPRVHCRVLKIQARIHAVAP